MASLGQSLFRLAEAALKSITVRSPRAGSREPTRTGKRTGQLPARRRPKERLPAPAAPERASPGSYSPQPGNTADPGEIVWTWVPYEDDPNQGKDRPVLIIGRDGGALLALMLTSRDRNNAENRHEGYVDIGSGAWDRQGRPSEVYLERLLRIAPEDVRRVGAILDRPLFDRVMSRWDRASGQ
jgi:hypothetical protein